MKMDIYYYTTSGWKLVGRTDRFDTAAECKFALERRGWICEVVGHDASFDVDRRQG